MNLIKYTRSRIVYFTPKWLKRIIYAIWRYHWRIKIRILPDRYYVDPYAVQEVIYVNPEKVVFAMKKEYNVFNFKGRVLGGDWDKDVIKFEDLDFFRSFRKRIQKSIPWKETEYYKRVAKQIEKGIFKWSCKTVGDFDKRCGEWDKLYLKIKKDGYKEGWHEDEITVNIGRNGELIFNNGRHRLTFAKLLRISKIPVKVTVRHKKWVAFKKEILEYSQNYKNKIYEKLTHPDLINIPSVHSGARYNIIKKNLTVKKGKLLDIGCNWGYFCHKFEEEGFECYCVENSRLNLYFLEKLKKAGNRKFKIVPDSVFEMPSYIPKEFDVILALSIFHHFIKKEGDYKKLIDFLQDLKGKEMFFEPHRSEEGQMKKAYRNFDDDEFAEFLVQNSSFSKFEKIGTSERGRNLYKIY